VSSLAQRKGSFNSKTPTWGKRLSGNVSWREEVRKVKREVLLEILRDESGTLSMDIPGTDVSVNMPDSFWKDLIEKFGQPTGRDEFLDEEDLARKKEVIRTIRQTLESES